MTLGKTGGAELHRPHLRTDVQPHRPCDSAWGAYPSEERRPWRVDGEGVDEEVHDEGVVADVGGEGGRMKGARTKRCCVAQDEVGCPFAWMWVVLVRKAGRRTRKTRETKQKNKGEG